MKTEFTFTIEEIMEILPHRPPFLFVDKVVKMIPGRLIVAERKLHADEPHFKGHFPSKPIMPGVLITDALAQTGGLLYGFTKRVTATVEGVQEIFFLAAANMKYTHPAYPEDILRLTAETDRSFGNFHTFNVEASVGRHLITKGSLTLAMMESL